jgi:hypothetical protein
MGGWQHRSVRCIVARGLISTKPTRTFIYLDLGRHCLPYLRGGLHSSRVNAGLRHSAPAREAARDDPALRTSPPAAPWCARSTTISRFSLQISHLLYRLGSAEVMSIFGIDSSRAVYGSVAAKIVHIPEGQPCGEPYAASQVRQVFSCSGSAGMCPYVCTRVCRAMCRLCCARCFGSGWISALPLMCGRMAQL